jgi:hypothetical protein
VKVRIGDIAAALAILGLALFGAYVAFVVFALRCDESCFDPGQSGRHWSDYQDSWQWSVMGAFAVIGLLGAFALVARAASDGVAAARWEIGVHFSRLGRLDQLLGRPSLTGPCPKPARSQPEVRRVSFP